MDYDSSQLQTLQISKPSHLYLEVTVAPILDAQSRVVHSIVQHLDITDRKQAEDALEHSRVLLEAVIEQSPVPIVLVTAPDLVVRYTNKANDEYLGLKEEFHHLGSTLDQIKENKTWRDIRSDGSEMNFEELPIIRAIRGETTRNIECGIIRQDGTQRWSVMSGTPIYSNSGELLAGMVIFSDITNRKQSEEALKESQERVTLALQGADLGSWDWNIQTDAVVFNERLEQMLGYIHDDIGPYMHNWLQLIHPDDLPGAQEAFNLHFENKTPSCDMEFRIRHKNGSWVWVLSKGKIIARDSADRPLRAVGTHLDITERKLADQEREKLQDQLQQAMKMEAIGRLAGGVAHDFNNLLTAIIGNLELAQIHVNSVDPLAQYLDQANKAADSAAALTRQLLAFSRRQIIEPQVLNPNDLINNLQKMLVRLIGEDIAFQINLKDGIGSVRVDPGQFEQVIVNLAVNARDSMPNGGTLQIETSAVELDHDYCIHHPGVQPGPYVLLAVSDTGHGMSDEVKARIFEPFFTTKSKGRGTGLGLATIFGAVKQAGGTIDVYSELGIGTTFKIYLPIVEAPVEKLAKESVDHTPQSGHETILLVEDEEAVRAMALQILQLLGYTVLSAPNGTEALALAEKYTGHIDMLMTDVVMPGINGRELSQQLLSTHPDIEVLFTSGYTENVIVHHGVVDADLNFIGKPYTMQTLAQKIRDVLDKHKETKP